ncbi:MAG: ABC transporter ATP-binding protein [Nitratireductor sp.]|nr:ABC transporter ATP-binding protein [Nitratireductor sp.]MCC0019676.1 ABC transporter ATP-binding protein [Nitratireductor sp.]
MAKATTHASRNYGGRNKTGVAIASSLAFSEVSHSYGDTQTLFGISLQIGVGEVVSLLGPSGSGKTTLLRMAAGLLAPTQGTVSIDGRVVAGDGQFVPPERRGVGLVFQDFALFPHMTIRGNVEFGLTALERAERRLIAIRLLEQVGLADRAENFPGNLSGGEQQRVALARALAPRPGILLMDEPFSGLDARLRDTIREETLGLLRATRSTVVIVTHDPEEALKVSDRIALMRNGRIVQTGTCEEVYEKPADLFAAEFFSQVNRISGRLEGGVLSSPLGDIRQAVLAAPLENGSVPVRDIEICIRHSDILVSPSASGSVRRRQSDQPTGIPAVISARRFAGEAELVELQVQGLEQPLHARLRQGELEAGLRQVLVSVKPGKAMAFPASQE